MAAATAGRAADVLQELLDSMIEVALTLNHVGWNMVGPHRSAIQTLLSPQARAVCAMIADLAERMATLGALPDGRLTAVAGRLETDDYPFGCYDAIEHLRILTSVYDRVIGRYRTALNEVDGEPVSQYLLTRHASDLEKFQWQARTHIQPPAEQVGC